MISCDFAILAALDVGALIGFLIGAFDNDDDDDDPALAALAALDDDDDDEDEDDPALAALAALEFGAVGSTFFSSASAAFASSPRAEDAIAKRSWSNASGKLPTQSAAISRTQPQSTSICLGQAANAISRTQPHSAALSRNQSHLPRMLGSSSFKRASAARIFSDS